jgi:hypothetical protein
MRLGILCLGLLAAVAAQGQRNRDDTAATQRACSVADCFHERDVRDFEVIDQNHVIVYTGSQRCAFHVELRGSFCDLTFAPELYFTRANEVPDGRMPRGGEPPSDRAQVDPFDILATSERERRDLRVCSNDLGIMVHGGRFTESTSPPLTRDRFGQPQISTDCRVSSVASITDDQLVEFYVGRGVVPPLPPMGTGQIEVGEQEEPVAPAPNGAAAPDAEL